MPKTSIEKPLPEHFKGKEAIEHVVEAQAQGIIDSTEAHGEEIPGHISSMADAARETALVLTLIWIIIAPFGFVFVQNLIFLMIFSLAWLIWKAGRSGWMAWSRLERLHRVVEQERFEIEHHRQQEREELKELYAAKGFSGKLLDDVIDVLMADGDRLLRVMVEEELGLSLESYEHPLKQSLGAALGVVIATIGCLIGASIYHPLGFHPIGILVGALIIIGGAAAVSSYYQGNKLTPAIIWNVGLAILSIGTVYFLLQFSFSFPQG